MRKIIAILICVLIIPCQVGARNALSIAYPDFYPFFSATPEGGIKGLFYDIVVEAMDRRLNIPTQWHQMPWKRCQEQVKSGKFDAMITVPTTERALYTLTHPQPFYLKKLKLFTYAGHPDLGRIGAISSIRDIREGGYSVITYIGNGWHEKNIIGAGISSYITSEVHNVWKMLAAKRGDLVIEWPVAAISGIEKSGMGDKIIETCGSMEAMPFHLLINKKSVHTRVLASFNQVIKDMAGDGTMERILSAYGAF